MKNNDRTHHDINMSATSGKIRKGKNYSESDATTTIYVDNVAERLPPKRSVRLHDNKSATNLEDSFREEVSKIMAPKRTRRSDVTNIIGAKNDTILESQNPPKCRRRPPKRNPDGDIAYPSQQVLTEVAAASRKGRFDMNKNETSTTTANVMSTNGDSFIAEHIPTLNRRGRFHNNNPSRDIVISTENAAQATSKRTEFVIQEPVPDAIAATTADISPESNLSPNRIGRPSKDNPGKDVTNISGKVASLSPKRARDLKNEKEPITTALKKSVSEFECSTKCRHRPVIDEPDDDTTIPSEKPGSVVEAPPRTGFSKTGPWPNETAQNDNAETESKPSKKRRDRSTKKDAGQGGMMHQSGKKELEKTPQPRTRDDKMNPESNRTTTNNAMTLFDDPGNDVTNTSEKAASIALHRSRISNNDEELDVEKPDDICTLESKLSPNQTGRPGGDDSIKDMTNPSEKPKIVGAAPLRKMRRINEDSNPDPTIKSNPAILESKLSPKRRSRVAKDKPGKDTETASELSPSRTTTTSDKCSEPDSVTKNSNNNIFDSKPSPKLNRQPSEDDSGKVTENLTALKVAHVPSPRKGSANRDPAPKTSTTDNSIRELLPAAKRDQSVKANPNQHMENTSEVDSSTFCGINLKRDQSVVPVVTDTLKNSCAAPLPTRKSRRDVKPTRKLEEYYIHQAAMISTTRRKRCLNTEELPPEMKKKKLLQSSLGVPIDKAAESTLQKTNQQIMEDEMKQTQDDNEQGWYVKVATYLSADASGPRNKRGLASRSSLKGSIIERNANGSSRRSSLNDESNNDAVSACSTISCSSDIDETKSSSHRTNNNIRSGEEFLLKQPPEAVLVSQPPPQLVAAASVPTLFRCLSDYKPGTRFGMKVFRKDDKKRIVREASF